MQKRAQVVQRVPQNLGAALAIVQRSPRALRQVKPARIRLQEHIHDVFSRLGIQRQARNRRLGQTRTLKRLLKAERLRLRCIQLLAQFLVLLAQAIPLVKRSLVIIKELIKLQSNLIRFTLSIFGTLTQPLLERAATNKIVHVIKPHRVFVEVNVLSQRPS